ncbi:MAG: hydrogenase [Firmicutes bacterium]|nr:hydrogenase [Bacillota bacterium]
MEKTFDLFSIAILLSAFMLISNKRINSYINTFRIQGIILAMLAGVLGVWNLVRDHNFEILIVCLITIAVKVIYIPQLLKTTVQKVGYKVEKDFFLNIPISILICCGLVVLSYTIVGKIDDITEQSLRVYLANSIAVVLIGLFFMISRKKAIGQIIGFLVIENGLFTAAILSTQGMPMIVELGIFFDLLTAVLIMGILVFRINEKFDSIDIDKLKNLRG